MTPTPTAAPTPATTSTKAPAGLPTIAGDAVTAIRPSERDARPCNFGFLREVCVDDESSFVCFASTDPGSASPWHDHGESTTYALLLEGEAAVEFEGGERMELHADGTPYVIPPNLSHREINTGTTKNTFLVMRVFR